jgi:hypothetical protein
VSSPFTCFFFPILCELYRHERGSLQAVENETKSKLLALRSDNGGEYFSNDFEAYLRGWGIKQGPHTPQQDGVAERANRAHMERVRTMLT